MRSRGAGAWLTLLGLALLAAAVGVLAHSELQRPSPARPGFALVSGARNPSQAAQRTLRLELRSEHLSFRHVVCIKNGRAYQGRPIIRCNVDFGDPHVEAYCSVILAGRLITNQQDPSIPCGPDMAGSRPLLFPSPRSAVAGDGRRVHRV